MLRGFGIVFALRLYLRCLCSCLQTVYRKDMTITIYYNKPPDRKWGWSVDEVRPRRDGPENLRILKRQLLRFLPLRHAVEFLGSQPAEMN